MRPPATDRKPVRRWSATVLVTLVTVLMVGYAARAATAAAIVANARSGALLADRDPANRATLRSLRDSQVRMAVAGTPLNQRVVNVAMAYSVDRDGNRRVPSWMQAVSRLGWRDTVALQNMIYVAAENDNLAAITNISDALLRRRQLTDQIIPVLSITELNPQTRRVLADRLAARPSWRNTYLGATGHLGTPNQLSARFQLVRELQQRQSSPVWSEMAPNIRALENAGWHAEAFALWASVRSGVVRPLDDTHFLHASESYKSAEPDPVPFQWQIASGEGFDADASSDGQANALNIDWNGRGVPVFAQQRTSGGAGRYALDVGVDPSDIPDLTALDFRLVCGTLPIPFQPDPRRPTHYVSQRSVPCSYPLLQIAGSIQSAAAPHQVALRSVVLRMMPGSADRR